MTSINNLIHGYNGLLVGRTSGNHRNSMRVLAVILSTTCKFFFICRINFIRVIWSGREMCPISMYSSTFIVFSLTTIIRAEIYPTLVKTTLLTGQSGLTVVIFLPTYQSRDVTAKFFRKEITLILHIHTISRFPHILINYISFLMSAN